METSFRPRTRMLVLALVLAVACFVPSAWALGPAAPPVVSQAGVHIGSSASGSSLNAYLQAEIPGGIVPLNVQSVTVQVPGEGSPRTMPLDRDDLNPNAYNLNLTAAGVVGFPLGDYVFTITDTAGGVTVKTDALSSASALPAVGPLTISGLAPVPAANGMVNLLDLAGTPRPTITWSSVAGALLYRVRIRGGLMDPKNLYDALVGTATSHTIPEGVLVPGRRYTVRVEAYDHVNAFGCSPTPCTFYAANARSANNVELITPGPEVSLSFGRGPYTAGQTLNVSARIYNQHVPAKVDIYGWIGIPGGGLVYLFEYFDVVIPPNPNVDFFNGVLFSHTFGGSEPAGHYNVGMRLFDSATGQTVAEDSRTFTK